MPCRAVSDQWLNAETTIPVSFKSLILPDKHPPHTELLNLDPLPLSALDEPSFESLYSFTHFNPIQTQAFHTLYHTDENALLGAPTGSGKTIVAELAMLRVFREYPGQKVIYIAPLKVSILHAGLVWCLRQETSLWLFMGTFLLLTSRSGNFASLLPIMLAPASVDHGICIKLASFENSSLSAPCAKLFHGHHGQGGNPKAL